MDKAGGKKEGSSDRSNRIYKSMKSGCGWGGLRVSGERGVMDHKAAEGVRPNRGF